MLSFETNSCTINEDNALIIYDDLIAAFEDAEPEAGRAREAKNNFQVLLELNHSVEAAIKEILEKFHDQVSILIAHLTTKDELKIYKVGNKDHMQINDESENIIYRTPTENSPMDKKSIKPIHTIKTNPGCRIIIGTESVFTNVPEEILRTYTRNKITRMFSSRALAHYGTSRRKDEQADELKIRKKVLVADLVA